MVIWPEDYIKYVLEPVKKFNGRPQVTKAGLVERITTKKVSPEILFPNPDDEFSMENVGPSMSIVSKYQKKALLLQQSGDTVFKQPVIVEKLKEGGYLLLNGHHRWYAALRMGIKKIHIKIVNLVHEEDLTRMMNSTSNTKRVSFDLDEILLAGAGKAEEALPGALLSDKLPVRLRAGAPQVIRELQKKGYDIWVYTADYFSEGEIGLLFEMYDLKITGAINGLTGKRAAYMKEANKQLSQKYQETINIDNESLLVIYSTTKDFDNYIFEDSSDWSGSILKILEKLS